MKNYTVVEILEVTQNGIKPVEMKGFNLLRAVYAAGSVAQGHEEIQEGSMIKRAAELKKKELFQMEEGDYAYGVSLETGYSKYTKKERSFLVLAKPKTITGLTTEEAKKVSFEDLF
jgi:hypothetical protein